MEGVIEVVDSNLKLDRRERDQQAIQKLQKGEGVVLGCSSTSLESGLFSSLYGSLYELPDINQMTRDLDQSESKYINMIQQFLNDLGFSKDVRMPPKVILRWSTENIRALSDRMKRSNSNGMKPLLQLVGEDRNFDTLARAGERGSASRPHAFLISICLKYSLASQDARILAFTNSPLVIRDATLAGNLGSTSAPFDFRELHSLDRNKFIIGKFSLPSPHIVRYSTQQTREAIARGYVTLLHLAQLASGGAYDFEKLGIDGFSRKVKKVEIPVDFIIITSPASTGDGPGFSSLDEFISYDGAISAIFFSGHPVAQSLYSALTDYLKNISQGKDIYAVSTNVISPGVVIVDSNSKILRAYIHTQIAHDALSYIVQLPSLPPDEVQREARIRASEIIGRSGLKLEKLLSKLSTIPSRQGTSINAFTVIDTRLQQLLAKTSKTTTRKKLLGFVKEFMICKRQIESSIEPQLIESIGKNTERALLRTTETSTRVLGEIKSVANNILVGKSGGIPDSIAIGDAVLKDLEVEKRRVAAELKRVAENKEKLQEQMENLMKKLQKTRRGKYFARERGVKK